MKKLLIYIIIINFNISSFCQQQCTILYTVASTNGSLEVLPYEGNKEEIDFFKNLSSGADETLKKITYKLSLNNESTAFKLLQNKNSTDELNQYALFSASEDEYYTKSDTLFRITEFSGKKFILSSKTDYNWTLINEQKTIDGFVCYKATTKRPWKIGAKGNENKTDYTITAWYCPKIPIKHGPKGFGNLPGLILELQDNRVTFLAKNINLSSSENIDFTIFKKHTQLTEDEFNNKIKEIRENFFKRASENK